MLKWRLTRFSRHEKLGFPALALISFASFAYGAPTFSFVANLDVSGLSSAPNGPFFLDLALITGDGSVINSVTFSDFVFTGGAPTGAPAYYDNASGDFTGSVTLDNGGHTQSSEMFGGFTSSTTGIRFLVTTTQNLTQAEDQTDSIMISILNGTSGNPWIATNASDVPSLIKLNITDMNSLADVGTYSGLAPTPVSTSVTAVPEPATYGLLGAAALGVAVFRRRRARA